MLQKGLMGLTMLMITAVSFAQKSFTIGDASKHYAVLLSFDSCDIVNRICPTECRVQVLAKADKTKVLDYINPGISIYYSADDPTSFNENDIVHFDDFNFDGTQDMAIRNGSNSGYGGPSYDVFVYHQTKKQFVKSKELTILASENLGLFNVDKKQKRLIAFQKSGCCWHVKREYIVVPGKGLKMMREVEEAAGEEQVIVTDKKWKNGKWETTVRKYELKEYYRE